MPQLQAATANQQEAWKSSEPARTKSWCQCGLDENDGVPMPTQDQEQELQRSTFLFSEYHRAHDVPVESSVP